MPLDVRDLVLLILIVLEQRAVVSPHLAHITRQLECRLVLALHESVIDARKVLKVRIRVAHQLHETRVRHVRQRQKQTVVLIHLQKLEELFYLLLILFDFLRSCLECLHLLLVQNLSLRFLSLCSNVGNQWLTNIVVAANIRTTSNLLLSNTCILSANLTVVHACTDIASASCHLPVVNRLLVSR